MYEKTKHDFSAANESLEFAGILARLAASVIDGIILALVAGLILGLLARSGMTMIQFISLALPVVYHWYFWTRRDGQSPGKSAVGIRVIKADGGELSDADAFIRAIGYNVSALLCGLGFIWAIFDRNSQSWHDKLAGTYVVNATSPRKTGKVHG